MSRVTQGTTGPIVSVGGHGGGTSPLSERRMRGGSVCHLLHDTEETLSEIGLKGISLAVPNEGNYKAEGKMRGLSWKVMNIINTSQVSFEGFLPPGN